MKSKILFATVFLLAAVDTMAWAANSSTMPVHGWRQLTGPHYIWPGGGAIYYSFNLANGSRANLIVVDSRSAQWGLRPAVSAACTAPTSAIATAENAGAAINGGYFNLKDGGVSASYVIVNGKVVADPTRNERLTQNPKLAPFLPQIFNRSELRILTNAAGKTKIQISKHDAPLPEGFHLRHSLQAGPRLLPTLNAESEAFVRHENDGSVTDAISVNRPAARTAFGITPDGYALLLCVADRRQDQESAGITLAELAALLKNLGCVEALNFDGGASTTMFVRLCQQGIDQQANWQPPGSVVVGRDPETLVKSVLLLEARSGLPRDRADKAE